MIFKIKESLCYNIDILGIKIYIAELGLINEIEAKDLVGYQSNKSYIFIGVPEGISFSPCSLAQAYLYYLEDKLIGRSRLRNPALSVLSYLVGETQINKFIDKFIKFKKIYVISKNELKAFCDQSYLMQSCNVKELTKLTAFRIKNII